MARLPDFGRSDPGLGNAGFLSPSARPAPVADVAGGLDAAAQGLQAYGQAQSRIRSREETLARTKATNAFFETAAEQYRTRLTEGGFRGKDDVLAWRQWLDETVDQTLGGYEGSEDGRAQLAERLLTSRAQLLDQAAGEAVQAQRAEVLSGIQTRTGQVTAAVIRDPGNLASAYGEVDAIIDDMADALMPEEEIELRSSYRGQVSAAAVEGMLAVADVDGAMELLTIPGVAETLTPQQQSSFAGRITMLRRDRDERQNERRRRLEDAAFALGTTVEQLPMWARVQAVGLQLPQGPGRPQAQSPVGKVLQDRQLFVEQFGEGSPQVMAFDNMTASGGEPPSLSDAAGIRKEFTGLAKDFVQVRDAYGRVETAASSPSPAGDLALIFNFMKILDPGSVVREGEFATAQNASGVPGRIRNTYNQLMNGERLNDDQRQDFLGQARGLYQTQLQGHRRLEEQFAGIAQRAGIQPEEVIVDFVGQAGDAGTVPPDQAPAIGATAAGAAATSPAAATPAAARGPGGAPVRVVYGLDGRPVAGGTPEAAPAGGDTAAPAEGDSGASAPQRARPGAALDAATAAATGSDRQFQAVRKALERNPDALTDDEIAEMGFTAEQLAELEAIRR